MTGIELALAALAAYRITRLVTIDEITAPPREWIAKRAGDRIETLVTCPFCAGFWISIGVLLVYTSWGSVGYWFVVAWALAGAQALLNALDGKLTE